MKPYRTMCASERQREAELLHRSLQSWKDKDLHLHMDRGKPCAMQLDLSSELLTVLKDPAQCWTPEGDARNYGTLEGLSMARQYFADLLGCQPEETLVGGNSSLKLMYDVLSGAYLFGLLHSTQPWCRLPKVRFLCPVPGYDRHFAMTQALGAELISIPMTEEGPDLSCVEAQVRDPAVKGMWCVPKFSNPDGTVYSPETVRRLLSLHPAAPDFTLLWDNAYCVHELEGPFLPFPDVLSLAREANNPDMVLEFASTSKMTFPGAGMAVLAASKANIAWFRKQWAIRTISYDKVNMLRQVLFLQNKARTLLRMQAHAEILRPKFQLVQEILERELAPRQLGHWTKPKGGYFVTYYAPKGTARNILEHCKACGVTMTPAGAAFPYGVDPEDRCIRIAPTHPTAEELSMAMEIFCLCVRLAVLEQMDA